MGTWLNRQNALLAFFKNYKKWVLAFLLIVALFEAAISYINHAQQQNVWKSVATLLRNEVNSANSYQISRALSDMESENWIKCVKLVETTNESRIFYDTTTQSYCGYFATKTEGILTAINGSTWQMSFASPENIWLLIVRLITPFIVALILIYTFQILEKQRKQQEAARLRALIEKDLLLDLTKQTRHDIASPIGALKLVVQRIEVAPEYAELLQGITERIEGIFSQLKDVSDNSDVSAPKISLEVVALDKLVTSIVAEKENEWRLESGVISMNVSSINVISNWIELGRIISNLLNNAIEAKRIDAPLKIDIDFVQTKKTFILRVQDNGIGIAPEVLAKIGTKGFSFGKTKENSGIGLYNAIKTVQSFGGEFKIDSEFGIGTTIKILLKLA